MSRSFHLPLHQCACVCMWMCRNVIYMQCGAHIRKGYGNYKLSGIDGQYGYRLLLLVFVQYCWINHELSTNYCRVIVNSSSSNARTKPRTRECENVRLWVGERERECWTSNDWPPKWTNNLHRICGSCVSHEETEHFPLNWTELNLHWTVYIDYETEAITKNGFSILCQWAE